MRILALILWALLMVPTIAAAQTTIRLCYINANGGCTPVGTSNPFPTTATISGFAPGTTAGTPITATTGGATGTLPSGAIVVATNTGTTNAAYCKLGAAATTSDQYIAPNGGWFAFTVGAATQLTCATSTSTTTVNMVGGSGIPTGTGGGGGGGGSGGSVTQGTSPWIVAGGGTAGTPATGVVTVQGIASGTVIPVSLTSTTITGTVSATQSGTWTVQPGNTPNTTPWLVTLSGTNNIATVTSLSQFAGAAINLGAGAVGTGTLRITQASDSPEIAVLGTTSDAAATAGSTGTLSAKFRLITTQLDNINTNIQAGAGAIAAAVPASAIYMGVNVGGNLTGFAPGTAGTASTQVVTVQGIASMTPLLVTPTANSAVNVAQFNGVTPLMGNGASGTGAQRVSISNDNTIPTGWPTAANQIIASGATGAAVPANASYQGVNVGGNTVGIVGDPCQTVARTRTPISITTATTTVIITGAASKKTYICHLFLTSAAADNVAVVEDATGTTCVSPEAGVIGGLTAANGMNFTANGGVSLGNGGYAIAQTVTNQNDVCLITSAATPLAGVVTWVQQ